MHGGGQVGRRMQGGAPQARAHHGLQEEEPSSEKVPGGQSVQRDACQLEKVPAGQYCTQVRGARSNGKLSGSWCAPAGQSSGQGGADAQGVPARVPTGSGALRGADVALPAERGAQAAQRGLGAVQEEEDNA